MYKRNSKILAALLTIVLVFSIFPSLRVNAAASGYCGDPSVNDGKDVTWTLDDAGVLTISGTGAMADYKNLYQTPWYSDMSNVTSIVISDGVTSIGNTAFWGCNKVTNVQIGSTVETIGECSFRNCSSIMNITLPENVQSIGSGAFNDCSALVSINIPAGVTKIESGTFYSCSNLKSITIPDSVTTIEIYAFKECTSLESVEIPASVTSYDFYAFSDCTNLKNVTIADGSTIIGGGEFYGCTSLESITIPDSVTSIGGIAFSGCTSLTSITIPDSVTSIGSGTFMDCTSLTGITIPDSVTSIGNNAFNNCTSLTGITIPDSVTDIGFYAFKDCTSLTDVAMSQTLYDKLVADGTLNDVFKAITLPGIHFSYTVDYKSNGNGTITGSPKSFGTDQIVLTVQPNNYYVLDKIEWSDGSNSGVLTETNGKYTMPDTEAGAVTITATFKLDQKTVTFKSEDGTVLQSGAVDCGTNPAYTGATPVKAEDDQYTYTFAGWSDGSKTYGPTDTLPAVTDDVTYTAIFTETAKPTPQTTPATTPATVAKPGTYYLNSMVEQDGNIIFTIKMSEDDTKTYDLLGSVSSDGVPLTEGNQYTAAKGSAIITINKSFLDTLAAGNHKLTVTFTDGGTITIDYEVKAPAAAPQAAAQAVQATGEAVSAASIAGVCLIFAAAGIVITVTRKRKETEG